jgi:hypothetical protein
VGIGEDEEGELHWTDNQMSRNGPKMLLRRSILVMVLHLVHCITCKHKDDKYSEAVVTLVMQTRICVRK